MLENNNDNVRFETAFKELQQIVKEIENDHINLDELSAKIKRAKTMVSFCQNKLRDAQSEILKNIPIV